MSAPMIAAELPDALPFPSTESISGAAAPPLLLHTPGPIPPVDDEDDDEDDDRKGGGKGGNIDPDDDDEDLDDDEDDDDQADKQWARIAMRRSAARAHVSCYNFVCMAPREPPFAPAYDCPPRSGRHVSAQNSGNPIIAF